MTTLTLRRPDDWHVHLRDGALLKAVLPYTARDFARAIVMPNLKPPVVTARDAAAYRDRIRAALPAGAEFEPLMAVYLTDRTNPQDLVAGARDGIVMAVKLYPAGATTNSELGVTRMDAVEPVLAAMEKAGVPLLIHGEVTDKDVDVFDREAVFVERVLTPLLRRHPALKIVLEHVTTKEGVGVRRKRRRECRRHHHGASSDDQPQCHVRGWHPPAHVLPARRQTRGAPLGTRRGGDRPAIRNSSSAPTSAPHLRHLKEAACGCAGLFTAPGRTVLLCGSFRS